MSMRCANDTFVGPLEHRRPRASASRIYVHVYIVSPTAHATPYDSSYVAVILASAATFPVRLLFHPPLHSLQGPPSTLAPLGFFLPSPHGAHR
ncbi:hypothetical protein CONPUDRAFT_81360 [Coniophora puteana RWD-64-598 SS2]|uniref:Uncharacterized protein n=1 Tax=Coniophora puteana (strain RWD-64-598) TaxID=741705 RepID=A0A5M3MW79_CONPW|nr:uncharacterized protein CONPUDRAFT_81360 [Coniophora puteana RWD-64-598 SS2]EIW83403.1 hypothetical protein CONPUDRAFT_81360 [Coniophora puteana RWD-64-598 SS2]